MVMLIMAVMSLAKPEMTDKLVTEYGYPRAAVIPLTIIEICCILLYNFCLFLLQVRILYSNYLS